jgi:3-isopropylmalate dehydratase small subunit
MVVTAKNFGAGSSRQQAVDCFKSLGISVIIAESFGAIYERNAVNAGLPILMADLAATNIQNGEVIEVDFLTGQIARLATNEIINGKPFSTVQMEIYQRGGLLN